MPDGNEIFKFLKENGLTQKDEATFTSEYSDPKKAAELHKFFVNNQLTTKDSAAFYDTYFNPQKKKGLVAPTVGKQDGSTSNLGGVQEPIKPTKVSFDPNKIRGYEAALEERSKLETKNREDIIQQDVEKIPQILRNVLPIEGIAEISKLKQKAGFEATKKPLTPQNAQRKLELDGQISIFEKELTPLIEKSVEANKGRFSKDGKIDYKSIYSAAEGMSKNVGGGKLLKEVFAQKMIEGERVSLMKPKVEKFANEIYKNKTGKTIDEEFSAIKSKAEAEQLAEAAKQKAYVKKEFATLQKEAEEKITEESKTLFNEVYAPQFDLITDQKDFDETVAKYRADLKNIVERENSRLKRIGNELNRQAEQKIEAFAIKYNLPQSKMNEIKAVYDEAYDKAIESDYEAKAAAQKETIQAVGVGGLLIKSLAEGFNIRLASSGAGIVGLGMNNGLTDWLRSRQQQVDALQTIDLPFEGLNLLRPETYATRLGKQLGMQAFEMALIFATRNPYIGGTIGMLTEQTQIAGDTYNQVLQETGDPARAAQAAQNVTAKGIGTVPLHFIEADMFLKAAKGIKQAAKSMAIQVPIENVQELTQGYGQFQETEKGKGATFKEYFDEQGLETIKETTVLTILQQGAFGGIGQAYNAIATANKNVGEQYLLDIVRKSGLAEAGAVVEQLALNGKITDEELISIKESMASVDADIQAMRSAGVEEKKIQGYIANLSAINDIKKQESELAADSPLRQTLTEKRLKLEQESRNLAIGGGTSVTVTLPNGTEVAVPKSNINQTIEKLAPEIADDKVSITAEGESASEVTKKVDEIKKARRLSKLKSDETEEGRRTTKLEPINAPLEAVAPKQIATASKEDTKETATAPAPAVEVSTEVVPKAEQKGIFGETEEELNKKLDEDSSNEENPKGEMYNVGSRSGGAWRYVVPVNNIPLYVEGAGLGSQKDVDYVVDYIFENEKEAQAVAKEYNGKAEEVYYGEDNQRWIRFKTQKDAVKFILSLSKKSKAAAPATKTQVSKQVQPESKAAAAPESADVESTAKALEVSLKEGGKIDEDGFQYRNEKKVFPIVDTFTQKMYEDYQRIVFEEEQKSPEQFVSEAYHKAKADGSNPELVKAVEELLAPTKEAAPQEGSVVGGEVDLGGGIKNNVTDKGTNILPISEIDNLRSQKQTDLATGNAVDLEKDLTKNGIKEPLVITYYPNEGKAVLTDGHNRLDVAKDMGAEKLPIRIVEKYTDAPTNAKDWTPPKSVEQSLKETPKAAEAAQTAAIKPEIVTEKEVAETAKKTGITPKNLRDLYNINRKLFGLDRIKSLAAAIAMDRMVGAMAKRAGITKEQMYGRLKFEKASEEFVKGLSAKGKVLFQLVGENAQLAQDVRDNLQVARDMETAGKDAKTIRLATGWEKGADGKWRYEIPDMPMYDLNTDWIKNRINKFQRILVGSLFDRVNTNKENDIFSLYGTKLYNIPVSIGTVRIKGDDYNGTYIKEGGNGFGQIDIRVPEGVDIYSKDSQEKIKSILVHEIQHAIQDIEGFAKGGSPKQMSTPNDVLQTLASPFNFPKLNKDERAEAKQKTREMGLRFSENFYFDVISDEPNVIEDAIDRLEILNKISPNDSYVKLIEALDYKLMETRGVNVAFEKYKRLAGEVEARNVQKRMGMTPEQRRETLLSETEDVARDEQIVLFDSKGIQMQVDAWHGSPYQFDKFTTEKIGTGEGAQAFGWGLYFTDLESIAEQYAKMRKDDLSFLRNFESNGVKISDLWFEFRDDSSNVIRNIINGNLDRAVNTLEKLAESLRSELNSKTIGESLKDGLKEQIDLTQKVVDGIKKGNYTKTGVKYKATLHKGKTPDQYTWLEWDKPVSKKMVANLLFKLNTEKSGLYVDFLETKEKQEKVNAEIRELEKEGNKIINENKATNEEISEYLNRIRSKKAELKYIEINQKATDLSNQLRETRLGRNFVEIAEDGLNGGVFYKFLEGISPEWKEGVSYDFNDQRGAKWASLFLLENGIDGIKYPAESISRGATSDTARGFNYVVFDENAVSIEEVIKFQKDAEKARGAMMISMDGQAVIYALTDPNVSTPLHEMAHVFEHYLTDAERAAVQSWAGTKAWTTKTSEAFARGFEKYLAEGKAPTTALQKIFDKFKTWLTDIYNGITGSDIDIELNEPMREIYAKMLGIEQPLKATSKAKPEVTEQQIDQAAKKTGITPKNLRDLYKINRELFGLDRIKSLAAAIAMDRMVGVMAKRAGITKEQMYGRLKFEKDTEANVLKSDNALFQGVVDGKPVTLRNMDVDVVNGFYSPIEKNVKEFGKDKIRAKDWLNVVGKGDEAVFTGVRAFLEGKDPNAMVSKQEILDYMKDNRISVVEVVRKEQQEGINGFINYVKSKYGNKYSNAEIQEQWDTGSGFLYAEYDNTFDETGNAPKFSQYQLEGEKENYKEVLVTLPEKPYFKNDVSYIKVNGEWYGAASAKEKLGISDIRNLSTGDKVNGYFIDGTKQINRETNDNFKSSHFDEPNILVHLRMNTRTDADGNKVLFLEEVQSDWGQKGKKEGFVGDKAKELFNQFKYEVMDVGGKKLHTYLSADGETVISSSEKFENAKQTAEDTARKNADFIYTREVPTAPFVMDTNAWTKLGLKVALKEAVAQGVDKIAWTTGTQQFDRWGSEKISWKKEGNKWKLDVKEQVSGTAFEGVNIDEQALSESNVTVDSKERLREILNRNLKRERTEAELNKLTDRIWGRMQKEYSGTSLPRKEGMESFYGTEGTKGIVGGVAEKLFGQNLKMVDIVQGDKLASGYDVTIKDENGRITTHNFDTKSKGLAWLSKQKNIEIVSEKASEKITSTQPSIDITPALRAEVERGLALFQRQQGQQAKGAMVAADGTFVIYALTDPNVSTPLHEMAHVFEHYLTDAERTAVQSWAGTKAWTTQTSEAFARGFEKYLAEGKAPTTALQKIFEKFKQWLTDIYNGITGSEIDIELNDQMREIYAKMLGEEFVAPIKKEVTKERAATPITPQKKSLDTQKVIEAFEKISNLLDLKKNKSTAEQRDITKEIREASQTTPKAEFIFENWNNIKKQLKFEQQGACP